MALPAVRHSPRKTKACFSPQQHEQRNIHTSDDCRYWRSCSRGRQPAHRTTPPRSRPALRAETLASRCPFNHTLSGPSYRPHQQPCRRTNTTRVSPANRQYSLPYRSRPRGRFRVYSRRSCPACPHVSATSYRAIGGEGQHVEEDEENRSMGGG